MISDEVKWPKVKRKFLTSLQLEFFHLSQSEAVKNRKFLLLLNISG